MTSLAGVGAGEVTVREREVCQHQGASRAAPEKSGLHACGHADRVSALESWEGLGPQDARGSQGLRSPLESLGNIWGNSGNSG